MAEQFRYGLSPWTAADPVGIDNYGVAPVSPQASVLNGFMPTNTGMGGANGMGIPGPGWLERSGLGLNKPTFDLGLGALNTIGGLWAASNAAKMAKKQFQFSKNFANANLANQTQSYNTAISDRARSRGAVEGQSASQIADYITKNSLTQRSLG